MRNQTSLKNVPGWVPDNVERYVAHTELGLSIRELARRDGCHASTVLRQIRKLETLRDDPLIDSALEGVCKASGASEDGLPKAFGLPAGDVLRREGLRVLRRLCETGALLAVGENMDNAAVVRSDKNGGVARTAVVGRDVAQAMALKDWISCVTPGQVARYAITATGRSELNRMIAEQENLAQGFNDGQVAFIPKRGTVNHAQSSVRSLAQKGRFHLADSPLAALSRRRDKNGQPFLGAELVAAGERLREDFELAQMGPSIGQNWQHFLTGGVRGGFFADAGIEKGPAAARQRVADALSDLGEGLSDVVLRCCCQLEGLEAAEKRLGWSARSAKIVLRIALTRLSQHYANRSGGAGDYIG